MSGAAGETKRWPVRSDEELRRVMAATPPGGSAMFTGAEMDRMLGIETVADGPATRADVARIEAKVDRLLAEIERRLK